MRALCLCLLMGCGAECPQPAHVEAPAERSEPRPRLSESAPAHEERMTLDRMNTIVEHNGEQVVRQGGIWELHYDGVPLTIVTDVRADRMRIVAAVEQLANLTPDQREAIMTANFHTALDARYAVSRGLVFSTFIHPLSTLHPDDLASGIRQTATLARTFGTTYNSGVLVFGGGGP